METQFLFVTCQVGSESILKQNLSKEGLRFSFSRPGFLTFKLPRPYSLDEPYPLHDPFARSYGLCLGKIAAETDASGAARVWEQLADVPFNQLHVWPRDRAPAGQRNFHPGLNDYSRAAEQALLETVPPGQLIRSSSAGETTGNIGRRNDHVLDCILVDPG